MVAKATKIGSLNHDIRFGHLEIGSLQKLACEKLTDGFDFDETSKLKANSTVQRFCQAVEKGRGASRPCA